MATHSNVCAWEIRREQSLVGYSPWAAKKELGCDLVIKQ